MKSAKLAAEQVDASAKSDTRKSFFKTDTFAAYMFLLPNIIGLLAFTAIPIVFSLVISFYEWPMISSATFVGFDNYVSLLIDDPIFKKIVFNTFFYMLTVVPLNLVLSLALALWVQTLTRYRGVYRSLFFIPVLAPPVALAAVWRAMYDQNFGLVNQTLEMIGLQGHQWLGDPKTALLSIVVFSVWQGLGYNFVILIAGLQSIPKSLYEAAHIDGAGKWRSFINITLPMLSPTMFFCIVMTVIASFQVFDQTMAMTGGGPVNATNTIVMHIYRHGFQFFQMGYAAAIGWILFAFIFLVTFIQAKLQKRWVHYD
jgi:multiple sugar transport system permease protein